MSKTKLVLHYNDGKVISINAELQDWFDWNDRTILNSIAQEKFFMELETNRIYYTKNIDFIEVLLERENELL